MDSTVLPDTKFFLSLGAGTPLVVFSFRNVQSFMAGKSRIGKRAYFVRRVFLPVFPLFIMVRIMAGDLF